MSHPTSLPFDAQEVIRLTPLSPDVVRRRITNFLVIFANETGVTAARPLQVLAAILTHSTSDERNGFCWPGSERLGGIVGCTYSAFRSARLALYGTGRIRQERREIADGTTRLGYVIIGWDEVHDDTLDSPENRREAAKPAQNSELRTPNSELRLKKALRPEVGVRTTTATTAVAIDPILDADIEGAHGEIEETFLITSQAWGCYRGWALKYQLRLNPSVTKHTLLCWRARAEVEGRRGQRAFWMACVERGFSEFSDVDHVRARERRLVEDWEARDGGNDVTVLDDPKAKYRALSDDRKARVRRWVCERYDHTTRIGRAVRGKQPLHRDDWAIVGEAMIALCL